MNLLDDEPLLALPGNACSSCGLYSYCNDDRKFAHHEESPNIEDESLPLMLVVISGYAPDAFSKGTEGGYLLRAILYAMEETVRWVVTGTVRCSPSGRLNKAVDMPIHRLCVSEFIPPLQRAYNPAAVVLLGSEAMQSVLGKASPKSILTATKKIIKLDVDEAPLVLVGRSPWAHRPSRGESLEGEWVELFTRAERATLGKLGMAQFPYREISTVPEAIRLIQTLPKNFTYDPEYDAHEDDPTRRTYWHDDAYLLCFCIVWKERGQRQSVTLLPPACNDVRVWEALFFARIPCAHFAKNDFQVPYALLGIDIYPWMERLPTGEVVFRDPGAEIHTTDQSLPGLGILSLAMNGWGAENWKQQKDEMIAAENKRLQAQWQAWKAWHARTGDAWADIKKWNEVQAKREHYALQAARAETTRLEKTALTWLAKNPPVPRPPEPPMPLKPELPAGTCGYAAAIPYLYHYCAEDGIQTDRALDELVPKFMAERGGNTPLVRRLLARITELTCNVERVGLPVDETRVNAAYEEFQWQVDQAKRALLRDRRVVEAVVEQNGFQEAVRKGANPEDAAMEFLNPGSDVFRPAMAIKLGVDVYAKDFPKTDKGNPSLNKKVVWLLGEHEMTEEQIAGLEAARERIKEECDAEGVDEKERTARQKDFEEQYRWDVASPNARIWRTFAQLKNAQDLISKLGMFRWVSHGVIRTDYKVVKVDRPDHEGGGEVEGGTETGRLSAGYLQGLKHDPAFRTLFLAPPGWVFLESDYSTLEPRILSFLANISAWWDWFDRNLDLYCGMANQMYNLGVPMDQSDQIVAKLLKACITHEERQEMKRCFLAQMYMQGAKSLSAAAGISLARAEDFNANFHRSFPQLKQLQALLWKKMLAGEPITTPFERQAYAHLPHPNDKDKNKKMADLHRHFWNLPTQGSSSDSCLWLGWEFMRWLQQNGLWGGPFDLMRQQGTLPAALARKFQYAPMPHYTEIWGAMCNLVHDALVSLVRVEHFTNYAREKARFMQAKHLLPFELPVRLAIEMKAGRDFSQMKTVDQSTFALPAGMES